MKKTERINTMMRFINNRVHFTIRDLMETFDVSRSTAIRDIKEIEMLGMPLVAEVGREGGYSVLHHAILPSVRFTNEEVKALFIAFMATKNKQLPFLKSRQSLAEKLIGLISQTQQDDLVFLNKMLIFEGTNPYNPDLLDLSDLPHPTLEKIIQLLLIDEYMEISLNEMKKCFFILALYHESGSWVLEAVDVETLEKQLLPINQIKDLQLYVPQKRKNRKYWLQKIKQEQKNVSLLLNMKAIQQFKKYHPFQLALNYIDPFQMQAKLQFHVQLECEEEMEEWVNWILFLGNGIEIVEMPKILKEQLKLRIHKY